MAAEGVAFSMFYKFQGVKVHVFITCSHTHQPSHMRWQEVPCGNVSQKQSLERCSFARKMSLPQKTRRLSGPAVHVSVVVPLQRALVVRCRGFRVRVSRRPPVRCRHAPGRNPWTAAMNYPQLLCPPDVPPGHQLQYRPALVRYRS